MSLVSSEYTKKLRELNLLKKQISALEFEVKRLFKKTIESDLEEKHALEIEGLKTYPGGLNQIEIRDYLCGESDAKSIGLIGETLGIQGNGPWKIRNKNGFSEFLENKDFEVGQITDPQARYLILGSELVDLDEVDEQIQRSIDEDFELRIYTQELFVAWLITGKDPLTNWDEEDLLKAVEGHEPMQYILSHEDFIWPEIPNLKKRDADYAVKTFEWDGNLSEESPLAKMGYTVRVDGITLVRRREILQNAYTSTQMDKYLLSPSDQERWGKPKTAQRLYAMARLIAWLAGFQGTTKPKARDKWEADLAWLKQNYYQTNKQMKFAWPKSISKSNSSGVNK